MMSLVSFLSSLAALDLSFLREPPTATVFILFLTIALNLATSLITRMTTNMEDYRRMTIESKRAQQEVMAAMRSGNQRRIAKAQKRQQDMMGAQSKMSMDRLKITMFFLIPLLLIWQVLNSFFGGGTIAFFPFNFPFIPTELNIGGWYIFCSFASSVIIQRVLGLMFEVDPEDLGDGIAQR